MSTRLLGNVSQAHLSPYDWPLVNNWLPTIEIWRGETQRKEESMSHRRFLPPTFNSRATPKLGLIGFFSYMHWIPPLFSPLNHATPHQFSSMMPSTFKKKSVTLLRQSNSSLLCMLEKKMGSIKYRRLMYFKKKEKTILWLPRWLFSEDG